MLKILKSSIALIAILMVSSISIFATDINMNLQANETSENETVSNEIANATNNVDNTANFVDDGISGESVPSGVSSIAQENMSFSNILNILIITVGVILILLAIAILIRLKG